MRIGLRAKHTYAAKVPFADRRSTDQLADYRDVLEKIPYDS